MITPKIRAITSTHFLSLALSSSTTKLMLNWRTRDLSWRHTVSSYSAAQHTKVPQAEILSHVSERRGFHTERLFFPFSFKQNINSTSILPFSHSWCRYPINLQHYFTLSISFPKATLSGDTWPNMRSLQIKQSIRVTETSMYLLVEFPCICIMHFDSLLVSLELKGRTLTATFTEAPDMVEAVVIQSHRMFSYKKKQNVFLFQCPKY